MASVNVRRRPGGRRSVSVNTRNTVTNGFYARVVRPHKTVLRRMTGRGSGQVGSF